MKTTPLKIGISACFFHPDSTRPVFKGKTLLYFEESLVHWVMASGDIPILIPSFNKNTPVTMQMYVAELDGLVLHGGSDVSPKSYGEDPERPEWSGDFVRDCYEIELLKEFENTRKPVLGICRGAQLMNVAFGGTLHQDITTNVPGSLTHRDYEIYEDNFHDVNFEEGSILKKLYPGKNSAVINSIHHQGIKNTGKNILVEARSAEDGIIEAIRLDSENFIYGVQWHPEFQKPGDSTLLDYRPLVNEFRSYALKRRG